ncbi:MAG: hypothetical protein JST80_03185 [Bdellovibrionales bacterium]|nr:hypothetical protein [Bdellovibrionales bacterium]
MAYNADQGALTAAQVKTAAQGSLGGALAAKNTVAVSSASTPTSDSFASLPEKVFYTVYAVAENAAGLDTDAHVKKYSMVIARQVSQQVYTSGLGTHPLVRYLLYYPAGYYDSASTFPLMMYIHGGGETANSPTSDEADFTTAGTRMDKTPFYVQVKNGMNIPFVSVAPQCNSSFFSCSNANDTAYLDEVMTNAKGVARINLKKLYVYGMSWGGSGAWAYGYDYPANVTAIVPVSGGLMYRANTNLCTKFVTNNVSLWSFLNSNDHFYNAAAIGGAGTDNATATGIYQGCTGHKDARSTVMPGNIYPATINDHFTLEYVLNIPFFYYSSGWYYNNAGSNTFDMALPGIPGTNHNVPFAPEVSADFATATTQLGSPITSIYDWMALQSKP